MARQRDPALAVSRGVELVPIVDHGRMVAARAPAGLREAPARAVAARPRRAVPVTPRQPGHRVGWVGGLSRPTAEWTGGMSVARALPAVAVVLAALALAVAALRPGPAPFPRAELDTLSSNVAALGVTTREISDRLDAIERSASASPSVDLEARFRDLAASVDDLAAGVEDVCEAVGRMSSRIDDLEAGGSDFFPPPPRFGSC